MLSKQQNEYNPDYVSPPGETLIETIEQLGISQATLAERTGRPKKTISEIITGKAAITPETAIQLERALGVPARFWNNREREYREALARQEEAKALQGQFAWLEQFPLKDMAKKGWIELLGDNVEQLRALLNYFGIASPEQWKDLWYWKALEFRRSSMKSDVGALSAWVRQGEIVARAVQCAPFDAQAFKSALKDIRKLTTESPATFIPRLRQICAARGVAVVFVPELPGTRVFGVTQWLSPQKALIQLSLRYKTNDLLWFNFFHEAAHIVLHGKKERFLEGAGTTDGKEDEANQFAANVLIAPGDAKRLKAERPRTKAAIIGFAEEIGIAPGIVVGRLQHERILPPSHCNDLKVRFEFVPAGRG